MFPLSPIIIGKENSKIKINISIIIFILNFHLYFNTVCQDSSCLKCSTYENTHKCTECIEGYFVTSNNNCGICAVNCKLCKKIYSSISPSKSAMSYCKVCNTGYFLQNNGDCVKLENNITTNCLDPKCQHCSELGECLSCIPGYSVDTNNKKLCWKCDINCSQCQLDHFNCSACKDNYFLDGKECFYDGVAWVIGVGILVPIVAGFIIIYFFVCKKEQDQAKLEEEKLELRKFQGMYSRNNSNININVGNSNNRNMKNLRSITNNNYNFEQKINIKLKEEIEKENNVENNVENNKENNKESYNENNKESYNENNKEIKNKENKNNESRKEINENKDKGMSVFDLNREELRIEGIDKSPILFTDNNGYIKLASSNSINYKKKDDIPPTPLPQI